MKRTAPCFSRLNAGNTGQPVFLASVFNTRVKVEGRNEAADMDQLQYVKTRVTEIGYMCLCQHFVMHGQAPNPKAAQTNFRGQDPSFWNRIEYVYF